LRAAAVVYAVISFADSNPLFGLLCLYSLNAIKSRQSELGRKKIAETASDLMKIFSGWLVLVVGWIVYQKVSGN